MNSPAISIIIVPREQFSVTERCVETLYRETSLPFELIYVDGNSPDGTRDYLQESSQEHGFTLLRSEHYLSPNTARNWAVRHATGEHLLFLDNDLIVSTGWLESLVDCAQSTGAWAVGPLYLEGEPSARVIHMAGGEYVFSGTAPEREFHTEHLLQHANLDTLDKPLARGTCGFVEFHCMLLTRSAYDAVGGFDERLLNTREHLDLCVQIHEAGGSVWFEPASLVTYKSPPPLAKADMPFFLLRWSENWTRRSLRHFMGKYGLDASYENRAAITAARRSLVFRPVSQSAGKVLGGRGGELVHKVLSRLEQIVNRLFVRGRNLTPGAVAD